MLTKSKKYGLIFDLTIMDFSKHSENLDPKVLKKAAKISISRALKGMKTDVVRAISRQYNIKQKDISDYAQIRLSKVSQGMGGDIRITGKAIPLHKFTPNPAVPRFGNDRPEKGFSVEVTRGKRKVVKGSFMAVMPKRGLGLYKRQGDRPDQRDHLVKMNTISIPQMAESAVDESDIRANANTRFSKEFDRDYSFLGRGL